MDLLGPALTRIARLEAAAADALAPAEERRVDGWRFRFNHGVSRRGNSVLAEARGRLPLARKLREVEEFYRDHDLPPRVQLSAATRPGWLDAELEDRGWRLDPGAQVMWASVGRGVREPDAPEGDGDPPRAVQRHDEPEDAYLAVQRAVTPGAAGTAAARAEALRAAGLVPWHLALHDEGRPISAGLGVFDPARAMVGVFSVATVPDARGRGAARRVMAALAAHAREAGAHGLYLQVDVRNDVAMRAYARSGYVAHHRYDYRVKDPD